MSDKQENRRIKAYERMLERLDEATSGPGALRLREALERVKQRSVELGELTREEADRIGEYLRRDIEDAANYAAASDEDLGTWLYMDMQLIENWIWDRFSSVADRTRLELLQFQQLSERPEEYHTGEVAGPGTLTCVNCGKKLQFEKPGRIPPCPNCHGSTYVRRASQEKSL